MDSGSRPIPKMKTVNQAVIDLREADKNLKVAIDRYNDAEKAARQLAEETYVLRSAYDLARAELEMAVFGDDGLPQHRKT